MAREINLQTERDRLYSEMQTIQDEISDMDPSSKPAQAKKQIGFRLGEQKRGVEWAMEEWDIDSITVQSLTLGHEALIMDAGADQQTKPGTYQNYQMALGTVDAPYLEHDPADPTPEAVQRTVAKVGNIESLAFGKWLLARIDSESAGNWNDDESFAALLQEIPDSSE